VNSTRYCTTCSIDVKIGFGRESNWEGHVNGSAHTRLAKVSTNQPSVLTFFAKFQPKSHSAEPVASTNRLHPALTLSSIVVEASTANSSSLHQRSQQSTPDHEVIDVDDFASPSELPSRCSSPPSRLLSVIDLDTPHLCSHTEGVPDLFHQLRNASQALPTSVPYGTADDKLARFSASPVFEVHGMDCDKVWEYIDKATDQVFGYGMSAVQLSPLIRRGLYGMDGVCEWLEQCVKELGIDVVLLEGRVEWLIKAMKLL
jgi:hypothetical protein